MKEDAAIEQHGDLSVLNKVANAVTSTFLRRPTQMYRGDEAAKQQNIEHLKDKKLEALEKR